MDLNTQLPAQDPRQKAILAAAFDMFRQYGFRRTSMEDIARAAAMSRAALYLHYRNKEDIFQSLVQLYFDSSCAEVTRILALDLPAPQALAAAFAAQGGPIVEALMNSPHGAEFMDAKTQVSADLVRTGEARLAVIYTDWLSRQAAAGVMSLDSYGGAEACARTILAALNGMKTGAADYAAYAANVARLAGLFGRALSA